MVGNGIRKELVQGNGERVNCKNVTNFKKGGSPMQWERPKEHSSKVTLEAFENAKSKTLGYLDKHHFVVEVFKCLTHLPKPDSGLRW